MNEPIPILAYDLKTLSRAICTGESTIEAWVKQGKFPAGRLRGGKRYWKPKDVERWLDQDDTLAPEQSDAEDIRNAARRAQGR